MPPQKAVKLQVDSNTNHNIDAGHELMSVKVHMSGPSPFVGNSESEVESGKVVAL
jgi:hypothetical protein